MPAAIWPAVRKRSSSSSVASIRRASRYPRMMETAQRERGAQSEEPERRPRAAQGLFRRLLDRDDPAGLGSDAQPARTSRPWPLRNRTSAGVRLAKAVASDDSATGSPLSTAARIEPAPAASRRPFQSKASAYPCSPTRIRCTCRCSSSRSSVVQTAWAGFAAGHADVHRRRQVGQVGVRGDFGSPRARRRPARVSAIAGTRWRAYCAESRWRRPRLGASSVTSASLRSASGPPPTAMAMARSISRCCAMYVPMRAAACSAMASQGLLRRAFAALAEDLQADHREKHKGHHAARRHQRREEEGDAPPRHCVTSQSGRVSSRS